MSAAVASLVLVAASAIAAPESWKEALEQGEYRRAWEMALQHTDQLESLVAQAEVLYRAGDHSGSIRAAESGLRLAPERLELLYHAAASALWLEDAEAAVAYATRLTRAIDALDSPLRPEQRVAWNQSAAEFQGASRALQVSAKQRSNKVLEARWIALAGLLFVLLLVAWVVGVDYGRSSKPVS
jgi:hypothetical protein